MSTAKEELDRIAAYGLRKHLALIDGYIFSGHGLDDLTIRHFVIQPDIAAILHAYGFYAGSDYGDDEDSRGRYRGMPYSLVEEYVTRFFPGLDSADSQEAGLTLELYFDRRRPDWRNAVETRPAGKNPWRLSSEERRILRGEKRSD